MLIHILSEHLIRKGVVANTRGKFKLQDCIKCQSLKWKGREQEVFLISGVLIHLPDHQLQMWADKKATLGLLPASIHRYSSSAVLLQICQSLSCCQLHGPVINGKLKVK